MSLAHVTVLRDSVMSEAGGAAQQVLAEARARAERIKAQARAEADAEGAVLMDRARMTAARDYQRAVGSAVLEARALRARRREVVLDRVFSSAAAQLETLAASVGDEVYASIVLSLVAEAAAQIEAVDALVIHGDATSLATLDAAALDGLSEACACRLSVGELLAQGTGVVVVSPNGRLRYDNTFQTRLVRMRDELRVEVARILAGESV
jgi:vacuolar-type H+-ATPase subunit E/Vma4